MKIGKLNLKSTPSNIQVRKENLNIGVNNLMDHIIKIDKKKNVEYIIDKVCDHNGGKLILKGDKAVCPMHNWQLNLNTLQYNDSFQCKEKIEYKNLDENTIELIYEKKHLENPFNTNTKTGDISIRWLNHATIHIEANGVKFITDPWLFGPAFLTGWWLTEPSQSDSIDLLKNSDFIFISHNHPDHLHAETLSLISKDKEILVGNFKSRSTEKLLKAHGFKNISTLEFNDLHEIGPDFQISILKSGDFRDDSGIYFNVNGVEILLAVDCNILNSLVLPQNIDLLMTSFASGASGFPLCFNDYSHEDKVKIVSRNRRSSIASVLNYLHATKPKNYMPYAGMFSERSERDVYIKKNNQKNKASDYKQICAKLNVNYIEPDKSTIIKFKKGSIYFEKIAKKLMNNEDTEFYISSYKEQYDYDPIKVLGYLKKSNFHKNQILQIIPTNDSFEKVEGEIVYANFKNQTFKIISPVELIDEKDGYRVMKIYVRKEIISCVIENFLPWEDLSIGFQMRIERSPNEYESDFWYHFTNNYINDENFRYSAYCGSCSIINQNPIWNKIN